MSIVAGIDFGTLSVRVSLFSKSEGRLGTGVAEYPLHRSAQDPNFATQSHRAQMDALERAMRSALRESGVSGDQVRSLALDATGSSVIHSAKDLSRSMITTCGAITVHGGRRRRLHRPRMSKSSRPSIGPGVCIPPSGGFSKLLHWLRHNPEKRAYLVTALENCDMIVATLCGVTSPKDVSRSICAMGHKWMWNAKWGGLPSDAFLSSVDPLLSGMRAKLGGPL